MSAASRVRRTLPNRAPSPNTSCPNHRITPGAVAGSLGSLLKTAKDAQFFEIAQRLPDMMRAGKLAAQFGPDTRAAAMTKNFIRGPAGIALGLALDGVIGGLESAGRNVDRRDISAADKVGRIGFGVGKGVVKGAVSTAGGALLGAGIGAVLGSVIPGPGTAAGAVLGAKLGVMLLSPAVEKLVTNKLADRFLPDRYEENVGRFTDQAARKIGTAAQGAAREIKKISAGARGALLGAVHLVPGWHF